MAYAGIMVPHGTAGVDPHRQLKRDVEEEYGVPPSLGFFWRKAWMRGKEESHSTLSESLCELMGAAQSSSVLPCRSRLKMRWWDAVYLNQSKTASDLL